MSKPVDPVIRAEVAAIVSLLEVILESRSPSPVGKATPRFATWHTPPPPDPILSRRLKRMRYEVALGVLLSVCVLLAAIALGAMFHIYTIFGAFSSLIAFPAVYFARRRAPLDLSNLADTVEAGPYYPVKISLSCDSQVFGTDTGLVTFIDGWMVYHGRTTTFSLAPPDVKLEDLVTPKQSHSIIRLAGSAPRTMVWRMGSRKYSLMVTSFRVLQGFETPEPFCIALKEWMELSSVLRPGVLPPLHPSQGAMRATRTASRRLAIASTVSAVESSVALVFYALVQSMFGLAVAFGSVVVLLMLLVSVYSMRKMLALFEALVRESQAF